MPPWIPNAISSFRVALVPLWVVFAEAYRASRMGGSEDDSLRTAALVTLLVLGASDLVDGYIARRFQLTTSFGATLDVVADKLAQVCLYTYFALRGAPAFTPVPLWFIGVLIAGDLLLVIGWGVVRQRVGHVNTEHQPIGKANSVLLFCILVWITAGLPSDWLRRAFAVAAGLSILTTGRYLRDGGRQLRAGASGQ